MQSGAFKIHILILYRLALFTLRILGRPSIGGAAKVSYKYVMEVKNIKQNRKKADAGGGGTVGPAPHPPGSPDHRRARRDMNNGGGGEGKNLRCANMCINQRIGCLRICNKTRCVCKR